MPPESLSSETSCPDDTDFKEPNTGGYVDILANVATQIRTKQNKTGGYSKTSQFGVLYKIHGVATKSDAVLMEVSSYTNKKLHTSDCIPDVTTLKLQV